MSEDPETRLRRLTMRSNYRGIKEMDLILGRFSAARLASLPAETLDTYDALLAENDQDLYQWITGQAPPPDHFAPLIQMIAAHVDASGQNTASAD